METRASFPLSLKVGLQAYYDNGYEQYEQKFGKVFNVGSSTKNKEEFSGSTGISLLSNVGENGAYVYTDRLEDYLTTLTHQTFKAGIQSSKEEVDDNQYLSTAAQYKALGQAAARTFDSSSFSVFRNAFNTSYTSYGDGKPLCSTSHTRLDGGSARSNASATNLALSETNLNTGMLAMDEVLDHQGQLTGKMGRGVILMVPPALRKSALEIVKSPLKSDSQNNDLNWYLEFGDIDVFINPWISTLAGGSNTAWFLIRKETTALHFLWREMMNTRMDVDDETDALKFKVRTRFSYGWTDPVGEVWGSQGTGTGSYSS